MGDSDFTTFIAIASAAIIIAISVGLAAVTWAFLFMLS